jgi:23S rRNA (uracil1939-C5)-methyltransferase
VLRIDDLAHDGRGIGRIGGKAVFVGGALPGESVRIGPRTRRARFDEARLLEILESSPDRVAPPCEAFGRCGGCALQHLAPTAQVAARAAELHGQLARIGKVEAATRLAPLLGPTLGYRRRARLGVRYLARERRAVVGFRGRDSGAIAELNACPVLAAPAAGLPGPLAALVGSLDVGPRLTQIEVAVTDEATVLCLRVLEPPGAADLERLAAFAREHAVEFWLDPGHDAPPTPLVAPGSPLRYRLPAFDLTLEFGPADFVQVNASVNEAMVARTVELLAPGPGDAVLDLFAGLGNFTLPIARRAGSVLGVDVEAGLVARGRENAARNGLTNVRFATADLARDPQGEPWARAAFPLVLLDPPRSGALEVLPLIGRGRPRRVVYISCHPGTLARDAGILVHQHQFRLVAAGVMDMFPHTAHLESIAVFEPTR